MPIGSKECRDSSGSEEHLESGDMWLERQSGSWGVEKGLPEMLPDDFRLNYLLIFSFYV